MIKKIITADNTETFLNEEVGESYHSQTGAVEEALKKYVLPCKIKEFAKTGKIAILDVCSGLGYNSAMAIDVALEENPHCQIEVFCLEFDPIIVGKVLEVDPPIKSLSFYKELVRNNDLKSDQINFNKNNLNITLIIGDARETCKDLPENHFDAVFFDPFSPKTAPEMWTEDFFKEMYRVMKDSALLATFSCARMVRENMSKAGLFYDDGPIVGRRGPGTIATKWI
ncbi:MAG: hypothetical protein KKA62_03775 [Nanoarchaeota archaeon]|nr:hypothetical protein [Nanoarchaeota archaeon]MBU1644154.1 hypothetical protein [Nanoarchaeota archaeon]MBU1977044.1 hypothetical protein [Nanoarchaeota archaeon]